MKIEIIKSVPGLPAGSTLDSTGTQDTFGYISSDSGIKYSVYDLFDGGFAKKVDKWLPAPGDTIFEIKNGTIERWRYSNDDFYKIFEMLRLRGVVFRTEQEAIEMLKK